MTRESLEELFSRPGVAIAFRNQPEAIPGDLRVSWRLSMLCMLLDRCRGSRAPLPILHVLWCAVRSASSRDLFLRWLSGERRPDEVIVRFDPSLSLTVDLGAGSGLVDFDPSKGTVALTSKGAALAREVWASEDVFQDEKAFLLQLPRITQTLIRPVLEWR